MPDTRNVLHIGQISSANSSTGSAKVACDDFDGLVSGDMQIVYPALGEWQIDYIPNAGDHVTILRLPNGKQEGFVIGTQRTGSNMPQEGAAGLITLRSKDGANVIKLNAADGTISLELKEGAALKGKNIAFEFDKMTIKGNVEIEGNLKVSGNIGRYDA